MFAKNLEMTVLAAADLKLPVGNSHRIKGCLHKIGIQNIVCRNTNTLRVKSSSS
jgi:hypothetical protein